MSNIKNNLKFSQKTIFQVIIMMLVLNHTLALKNPFVEKTFDPIFLDEVTNPTELNKYILAMQRAETSSVKEYWLGLVYYPNLVRKTLLNFKIIIITISLI